MGVAGPWGKAGNTAKPNDISIKIAVLKQYAEYIGWHLAELHLNKDDILPMEKVGLLKIAPVGEVVHGVGMRASETEFYILEEPK